MALTTELVALTALLACDGRDRPAHPGDPSHSVSAIDTADTSADEHERAHPPCEPQSVTEPATLFGDERGDYAGRWLDAADIDGDGCAELLIAEPYEAGDAYSYLPGHQAAVHLIQGAPASGLLRDRAFAIFQGTDEYNDDRWGAYATLLPGMQQLAMMGFTPDHFLHVFDIPSAGPLRVNVFGPDRSAGSIATPPPYHQLGVFGETTECRSADGGLAFCMATIESDTTTVAGLAGQVLLYDGPIQGSVFVLDARSQIVGDPGDDARVIHGETDLDGDGLGDLMIGAFNAQGTGRVALIFGPPDGTHRVWDIADATITGVDPGDELGLSLATGDLDDDGYFDVVAGAPLGAGTLYVSAGPFSGDRSVADAEWSVAGTEAGHWVGYSAAITDTDGDGAADLAVGAPYSVYGDDGPGSVFLFRDPSPGAYAVADAPIVLGTGLDVPDAFGIAMDAGDVDGDGLGDLVVGAPRDPRPGGQGGSAMVWYGASMP